ncbi:hypothetical protein [Marinoscillum sp.]|uniref:hypothetical protein n=1 Tax=Marinoscillum sp. TaxID=2024838 RepID=UPI003BAB13A1
MNQRKLIVVGFFILVFGLPVGWYLFLQAFGENKFALPVIEKSEGNCEEPQGYAVVRLDSIAANTKPNERQRVITKLMNIGEVKLIEGNKDSCKWNYEMSLVDHDGMIRGIYDLKREEVDRFLAEVDIYVLNYRNGTSTGK